MSDVTCGTCPFFVESLFVGKDFCVRFPAAVQKIKHNWCGEHPDFVLPKKYVSEPEISESTMHIYCPPAPDGCQWGYDPDWGDGGAGYVQLFQATPEWSLIATVCDARESAGYTAYYHPNGILRNEKPSKLPHKTIKEAAQDIVERYNAICQDRQ